MDLDALPPPQLIEKQNDLDALLARLEQVDEVAVDTEADSFFCYREKVCLIQVTAAGEDYLIDPLAELDLDGLGEVMADPDRVKIFHDSEFDILILKRTYGFDFAGLFDTRVAATALGREEQGLAAVLEKQFGVRLDKSQQRSNWGKRPLSEAQIGYARLDTRFLSDLRARQETELEERGRTEIVEAEFDRLCRLDPPARDFDPDEYFRLKGARTLDLAQQAVLRELFIIRDELARNRDQPPFKVLPHASLVELARRRPADTASFGKAAGIRSQAAARLAKPFLAAIQRGMDAGPLERPPKLPPKDGTVGFDDLDHELHDRIKELRKRMAKSDDLDSSLVLNRHTLLDLVRRKPEQREDLEAVESLYAWQIERYGKRILETVERFRADAAAGKIEVRARRSNRRRS